MPSKSTKSADQLAFQLFNLIHKDKDFAEAVYMSEILYDQANREPIVYSQDYAARHLCLNGIQPKYNWDRYPAKGKRFKLQLWGFEVRLINETVIPVEIITCKKKRADWMDRMRYRFADFVAERAKYQLDKLRVSLLALEPSRAASVLKSSGLTLTGDLSKPKQEE